MDNNQMLKIDIEKVLTSKNPALAKRLPCFLINYLKHITRQDELNDFLTHNREKQGIEFIEAFLNTLNVTLEIRNLDMLPDNKLFSFASNHPLGGLDGIALASILAKKYGNIKILVNDILMNIPNVANYFLPVNKHGMQARDAAEIINNTYTSNNQILQFPAGLVSRKQKGVIIDLEWRKTFIAKTIKYKRDIVPIHVSGKNSNFFYNLANIRKLLGIKSNFEMLYLPNEMYKFNNRKITITFGKPISYKTFDKSRTQVEWAEYVKQVAYGLKDKGV